MRIYFASERVEMRKGIDGLRAEIEATVSDHPQSSLGELLPGRVGSWAAARA